jgi:two-component system chemotaxis response regulator CheY
MSENKNFPILIADDEPFMRDLLASSLRNCGYDNIRFAHDGEQAIKLLSEPACAIKMAFLDISMPGFSGLEVLGKVKINLPNCFFVVVSAHSAIENVISALTEGARGFIVKPYTDQKIRDVINKFHKENNL